MQRLGLGSLMVVLVAAATTPSATAQQDALQLPFDGSWGAALPPLVSVLEDHPLSSIFVDGAIEPLYDYADLGMEPGEKILSMTHGSEVFPPFGPMTVCGSSASRHVGIEVVVHSGAVGAAPPPGAPNACSAIQTMSGLNVGLTCSPPGAWRAGDDVFLIEILNQGPPGVQPSIRAAQVLPTTSTGTFEGQFGAFTFAQPQLYPVYFTVDAGTAAAFMSRHENLKNQVLIRRPGGALSSADILVVGDQGDEPAVAVFAEDYGVNPASAVSALAMDAYGAIVFAGTGSFNLSPFGVSPPSTVMDSGIFYGWVPPVHPEWPGAPTGTNQTTGVLLPWLDREVLRSASGDTVLGLRCWDPFLSAGGTNVAQRDTGLLRAETFTPSLYNVGVSKYDPTGNLERRFYTDTQHANVIGVAFPNGVTPDFWVIAAYPGRPTAAQVYSPAWFGVEMAFEYAHVGGPIEWNYAVACSEPTLNGPITLLTPQGAQPHLAASSYVELLVPALPIPGLEATFQAAGITTDGSFGTWNWVSNPITLTVR